MKGFDFIFTGLQRWDLPIGSNAKDMAHEISKDNRVLYVNTPRKEKKTGYALTRLSDTLWVLDLPVRLLPINVLPDNFIFDGVNRFNQTRMVGYIRKAIRELGFKDYILFTDNDIYNSFFMTELLSPLLSVYYKRDHFMGSYWGRHCPRLEPVICRKYNLVVTNSEPYAEGVRPYNPKTTFIGQGMDVQKYNLNTTYPVPEDMIPIKRPIIGYIGLLAHFRLDMDLIYDVALALPDYSFLMVGRETEPFRNHKLHDLSNVYFPGEKKESEVRNYISAFDVCLNPQVINPITMGNYPRKIDEYLALGKPVVASATRAMEYFKGYVYCCRSSQEYVSAIEQIVSLGFESDRQEERAAFARSHSWTNCVDRLYQVLESELQHKKNKKNR